MDNGKFLLFILPLTALAAVFAVFAFLFRLLPAGAGYIALQVLAAFWLVFGLALFFYSYRRSRYLAAGFLSGGLLPAVVLFVSTGCFGILW